MLAKIDNREINYEVYGSGERLLLLHGWGLDLHTFEKITDQLSRQFQVMALDLPGFGQSFKISKKWGVLDFAYFVEKFLEHLDVKEINLCGHSFGGSVALYLTSFSPRVKKLILSDSAGVREKSWWLSLKIFIFKILKLGIPSPYRETFRKILGSPDYKKAGPLRDSLVRVLGEDLKYLLPKILVPTLIIWGENDEITTLKEAKIINQGIKGSRLRLLKDCGHFPHLEKPDEFVKIVSSFLKENHV